MCTCSTAAPAPSPLMPRSPRAPPQISPWDAFLFTPVPLVHPPSLDGWKDETVSARSQTPSDLIPPVDRILQRRRVDRRCLTLTSTSGRRLHHERVSGYPEQSHACGDWTSQSSFVRGKPKRWLQSIESSQCSSPYCHEETYASNRNFPSAQQSPFSQRFRSDLSHPLLVTDVDVVDHRVVSKSDSPNAVRLIWQAVFWSGDPKLRDCWRQWIGTRWWWIPMVDWLGFSDPLYPRLRQTGAPICARRGPAWTRLRMSAHLLLRACQVSCPGC